MALKVAFLLPDNRISGGNIVVFRQARNLSENGFDVSLIFLSAEYGLGTPMGMGRVFSEIDLDVESFAVVFATWWETWFLLPHIKSDHYAYFVQSDERRFYSAKEIARRQLVRTTYAKNFCHIVTEAAWIKDMFATEFSRGAAHTPNGVDLKVFSPSQNWGREDQHNKLRILIEGPGRVGFKRVGFCFDVLKAAGSERFDIELVSTDGFIKKEWRKICNAVHSRVSQTELAGIYRRNDLLLKLSTVEGVFGPPLEMMACGGTAIVSDVSGHEEYIKDSVNAVVVPKDNLAATVEALNKLDQNRVKLQELKREGLRTASEMNWDKKVPIFLKAVNQIVASTPDSTRIEEWRELSISKFSFDESQRALALGFDTRQMLLSPIAAVWRLFKKIFLVGLNK
jgi:O-antigen biosynthesis protein